MAWFSRGYDLVNTRTSPDWVDDCFDWVEPYRGNEDQLKAVMLWTGLRLTYDTVPPISAMPTFGQFRTVRKTVGDYFGYRGLRCVSENLKGLVESFEPGMHQFLPFELRQKTGERFPGQFYLINICQILDSVIPEKSNYKWVPNGSGGMVFKRGPAPLNDFMSLNRKIVGSAHVWRERKDVFAEWYVSDAFLQAIKKNKISGFMKEWYPATEYDVG